MVQSNTTFLRSYVRSLEYDLTQTVSATDGTVGSIVSEFRRGPLSPTYVSPSTFYNKYGQNADPTLSYGWDEASIFMAASANLLLSRVVNGALHAGVDIVVDKDAQYGTRILCLPFPVGTLLGYDKSGKINTSGVTLLKFSKVLATGNTFTMSVTDGETIIPISVPFSSDNNATLTAIALAIQSAVQTFSPTLQGTASVYIETSSPIADRLTIVLRKPNDASIEFGTPAVTGTTPPTASLLEADTNWLGTAFAENPGKWSSAYGIKLLPINPGTRSRYRITFSGPLVTGNTITPILNGVPLTPVPFNTDSDTTMADVATAIAADPTIFSASVETVLGAVNNDRSIVVIAKAPGPDVIVLDPPVVAGGTAQPIAVVNNILTGIASDGSMTLQVFNSQSVNSAIETYQFSTFPQTNARGDQLYYDNSINQGTGASLNIRFVGNPELATAAGFSTMKTTLLDPTLQYRSTIAWLAGGDDGFSVTSGQMIQALQPLTDRIRYPFNISMSAGYTDIAYMQALVNLSETRGDSTAILDMPRAFQGAQDATDFRNNQLNINNSYGAIYTPDVQITDISTGEKRYVPPSGAVAAAYVYNDQVRSRYSAPAGLNRGVLRNVSGLLYEYGPEELEMLNPIGINTIVNKKATGPTIMSEETLQVANSALRSVHIRRTLNLIKTTLADSLEFSLFEPNTESTRFNVVQLATSVLAPAYRQEGLYDYLIVCDETNNTPDIIDQDVLVVDIYVKPVRVAKGILLRSFITRTGISFTEVVAQTTI